MSQSLLKADSITMQFGGLKAVDRLSFEIFKDELVGLIGPNGAGKTTVFNMLTGVYKPTSGTITFKNQVINGFKPYQVARLGMSRTFQNIRLFKELTVLENVLIAQSFRQTYSAAAGVVINENFLNQESHSQQKAMELLSVFNLDLKAHSESSSLPYGEQRKLEIVRCLATEPQLICLDEPAAGMNHQETHNLMGLISQIRKQFNLTVLLIEHDMKLVMNLCERIVVLDHGELIEMGSPEKVRTSQKVIEAYLGTEQDLQG